MKTFTVFYAASLICIFPAHAQPFSRVTLDNIQNSETINFTIPREANNLYYRIEASNDSATYEIIGTIRSAGNSVLPKSYHYTLNDKSYKFYRVGIVGMNARLQYSPVIVVLNEALPDAPGNKYQSATTGPAIVKKQ